MSQRSSSKSPHKRRKTKSSSVSATSLANQLASKNPEAFDKLMGMASEASPKKKQPPQFLPGSLSSSKKSSSKTIRKAKKKSKRAKKKNIPNTYSPDKAQKYLQEVFGRQSSSTSSVPIKTKAPAQKKLVELFEEIDRTDSVKVDSQELSSITRTKLASWAAAFRTLTESSPTQHDNPVYVTIGFDFGTSSAKVIVRFPYESEEPAFALPVPEELRADNHPHCWKTLLWIQPETGQLSLSYKTGFEAITEIKTTAMQSNLTGRQSMAASAGMTPEITCLAYVGLMLRLIKGWLASDVLAELGIDPSQRPIVWELNMGLPASKKDDKKIADRFNGIAKYAWNLSNRSLLLFAKDIHFLMVPPDTGHVNADISIRPEVVAQTVGFVQADIADFGYYATVDVGASTLDICTFNFVNMSDEEKFNLFYSNVKLLGSESVNWLSITNTAFEKNYQLDDLKSAIKSSFGETVITTKLKKLPNAEIWSSSLPVFLCGGGKHSLVHKDALSEYSKSYKSGTFGELEFRDVAIPKNLNFSCEETDYHRLSVAWGLSIPAIDFNGYTMPSDIDDVVDMIKRDITDLYIGPEQV